MVPQISSLPAEAWPSPFDVAVLLAVALRPSSWLVMASPEIRSSPVPATMVSSPALRSEEHTSELQSLMRNSYAVFCLKNKKMQKQTRHDTNTTRKNGTEYGS